MRKIKWNPQSRILSFKGLSPSQFDEYDVEKTAL